ncbi:gas vesicle protein GvpN [Halorubellus salinus]|uniref:gas vesicle protein GvpN n=1 Tax=Halorubellus salinus TaxID=755309 RepID=UPI001D08731B|nr:gas vesicle protein GvpN [Halorubellus salinus]
MTGGNRRERKVRGSQIRSSREEPTTTPAGRRHATDRATDRDTAERSDRFVPDDDAFVETSAVRALKSRIDRWLEADRPVHLVGPTGCGKTALAMAVARERDRPVVFINGDADLETSDLVGEFAESERHTVNDKYVHNVQKQTEVVRDRWVDNPLTTAVEDGATLVYNEFSRTKPVANNVLLSVFEEGVLELPGQRGESRYVDVHPEFRAVLTSNSAEYAGVHRPQDALLDRLVGIHMDFYDADTERAIVREAVDDADPAVVADVVSTLRALRDEVDLTVGTRQMVMTAEGLSTVDAVDADTVADVVVDVLGSKVATRDEARALRETVLSVLAAGTTGLTSDSAE